MADRINLAELRQWARWRLPRSTGRVLSPEEERIGAAVLALVEAVEAAKRLEGCVASMSHATFTVDFGANRFSDAKAALVATLDRFDFTTSWPPAESEQVLARRVAQSGGEAAGELYPCKPDIFEQTYERVCEPADPNPPKAG